MKVLVGRDQLGAGLLGLQVQAVEGQLLLELGRLHRARVELGQLLLRGSAIALVSHSVTRWVSAGLAVMPGTDQLVADDRAVGVDRVAAGVVAVLVGVDQDLEVVAPELAGDDLAQLGVDLGDADGVDDHDALGRREGHRGGRRDVVADPDADRVRGEPLDVQRQPRHRLGGAP